MTRAAWITGPGQVELRPVEVPAPGPGQALVRTLFTGISRGTERLVLQGRVPPDLAETMRAPHQEGALPWPVKYGYCNVGVVEDGALPAGTRVFCLYPHQERYVVDASWLAPLPEDVPSERAVLAANVETALNALWDGTVLPGDHIVVVGCGVVGALIGWLAAKLPGAEVTVVDVLPDREALAHALGARFSLPGQAPGGADVVFHASGTEAGLRQALACAGTEGTVVEASWFGATEPRVPLGGRFFPERLRLVASQVGRVRPDRAPRWTLRRRLELALRLLSDPVLDALIDGESAFDDLAEALPRVANADGLAHRIRYAPPAPRGAACTE